MKSYFANSFQLAMEQARRELGPEAVLITNRAAAPEARHLGEYEAVFASELPPDDGIDRTAGEEPPPPSHATNLIADRSGTNSKSVLAEIRDLRQQFQAWRQFRMRSADQPRWVAGDPQLTEAFAVLVQAEMERDLALELISGAQNRVRQENSGVEPGAGLRHTRLALARRDGPLPASALWSALAAEIKDALYVDGSLGTEAHEPRVTALVGPPGAGKTATIAKLAVLYGLPARRPAMILSIDNLRVGASEQLRWYASILGIGFQTVETGRALAQTIEEHRGKSLILIDTPGLTFSELEGGSDAAEMLARRDDIQKQLVLPASMRSGDLARYAAAYDIFRPTHLVLTRVDETGALGPVLSEAIRSGRRVSFIGTGQRVPEDLEPATKEGLLGRLLPAARIPESALSAA